MHILVEANPLSSRTRPNLKYARTSRAILFILWNPVSLETLRPNLSTIQEWTDSSCPQQDQWVHGFHSSMSLGKCSHLLEIPLQIQLQYTGGIVSVRWSVDCKKATQPLLFLHSCMTGGDEGGGGGIALDSVSCSSSVAHRLLAAGPGTSSVSLLDATWVFLLGLVELSSAERCAICGSEAGRAFDSSFKTLKSGQIQSSMNHAMRQLVGLLFVHVGAYTPVEFE